MANEVLATNVKVEGRWLKAGTEPTTKDGKALTGDARTALKEKKLLHVPLTEGLAQRIAEQEDRRVKVQEEHDKLRGKIHELQEKLNKARKEAQGEKDEKKLAKANKDAEDIQAEIETTQAEMERHAIILDFLTQG